MSRICIIGNQAFSLINFRGHLIKKLIHNNHEVYAISPDFSLNEYVYLKSIGVTAISFGLSRTGKNILRDISDFFRLLNFLRILRPDVVISYTIKPVIYGVLAAWLTKVPNRYALITGLGYVFVKSEKIQSLDHFFLDLIVSLLYKISLSRATLVLFQNVDDLNEFVARKIVSKDKALLAGPTGIDLSYFGPISPVKKPVTFILIARLIKEKGILEYAEAAYLIKQKYPDTRFILLGGYDVNPGALSEKEIQAILEEGLIEWYGHVSDVRPWLEKASVFVLPSYREGCPRSSQEALAMGLPIITTNVPGCRLTVMNGKNGYLIPARDVEALVKAMERFCINPNLIEQMGHESRALAEQFFDIEKINNELILKLGL